MSRLRFNSREEAFNFAKHTVEDSQRRFASEFPVAYQNLQAEIEHDRSKPQPDIYDRFIKGVAKWWLDPALLRIDWGGIVNFTLMFASIYGTIRFFDWLFG